MTKERSAGTEPVDGVPPASDALRAALQDLARAEWRQSTPARVERALLAAWDESHRGSRRMRRAYRVAAAGAIAAGLGLTALVPWGERTAGSPAVVPPAGGFADVALPRLSSAGAPAPVMDAGRARQPAPASATPGSAPAPTSKRTVVLVGPPVTPDERISVVRMRIARDTLLEMGLRPVAPADDGPVDVEMIVGEDGVARGLRLSM